jgi:hypothetical protein
MSGVLATVRLMFTALPLQRWFLCAAVVFALLAIVGMIAGELGSPCWWTPVAVVSGCFLLVSSPPFVGPLLLRSMGASRAVRLIPRGRLQLLLGCFGAQIVVALIGTVAIATIMAYSGTQRWHDLSVESAAVTATFVSVFALATLAVVTFYYSSAHQYGFLLITVACGLISKALPISHWPLKEFLSSAPALLLAFVAATGVWSLFGLHYAGRARPSVPNQRDGSRKHTLMARSDRNAIRLLLTGRYSGLRINLGIGAGVLACFWLWTMLGDPIVNTGAEKFLAVVTAYIGIVSAAASIHLMIGRARYLWLKTRLDRDHLFQTVEAQSWRTLLSDGAFALAIAACLCLLARVPWEIFSQILLLSLVSGTAMIYVVLLCTRNRPVVDALLITAFSVLWFFGFLLSEVTVRGPRLLWLLAPQLLLIPLLRIWARSRWRRIDWTINRPLRLRGAR